MDSEDHDIEIQREELVVEAGDGEFRVGLLDIPAVFIGIRLAPVALHDHVVLENGFCEGVLSHEGFLSWVQSSTDIQDSKLVSIAWIRSNRNILHHQFIIVTVEYQSVLYDVKIERMGRMAGPGDVAKQTITIRPSVPLHEGLEGNDLILALVGEESALINSDAKQYRKVYPSRRNFVTFDDERWRGAPATLGQLARYSKIVVKSAPEYHLSSTNCYFYARLMMHIIVDRHLTFEYAVSPSLAVFEPGVPPRSSPDESHQGDPARAPKHGPPILFPLPPPTKNHYAPVIVPPMSYPPSTPIVVQPPHLPEPLVPVAVYPQPVAMSDFDEDEIVVVPPPERPSHLAMVADVVEGDLRGSASTAEQPPIIKGERGPFIISRQHSSSPESSPRHRGDFDLVAPEQAGSDSHSPIPVVDRRATSLRSGSESIIVRTRSPSVRSVARWRRSNSIYTAPRSAYMFRPPSSYYNRRCAGQYSIRPPRPLIFSQRRIASHSINIPNSSSTSRFVLESVLQRHEKREGTLLATYVESVTLFVASSVAMVVPLGMLIALILLLAVFGRPKAATPLAFALAPTLIVVLIALRIVMAIVKSHTKSISGSLARLRDDIFAEIESDHHLRLPSSVPRAFQHRSTLRKKEASIDFLNVFCDALKGGASEEVEHLFAEGGWLRVLQNHERILPSIAKSDIQTYIQNNSLVLSDLKVTSGVRVIELPAAGRKPDIQAFFGCSNSDVRGSGVAWLTPDKYGVYKANIVSLTLHHSVARLELRRETDPKLVGVVVVGAGMSGVLTAVQLKRLGVDVIVLEKASRPGNSWRTRYHAPELRFPRHVLDDEFFFPPTDWPEFISPVMMANWVEGYAIIMGLDIWTKTTISPGKASYDDATGIWELDVTRDGRQQTLHCYHIVMATGNAGGEPLQMAVPGQDTFDGTILYANEYRSETKWDGKTAIIIGCGNSGHDIAASLHKLGASVTLVQRSPTRVISRNASLAGALYHEHIHTLSHLLISYPPEILCHAKNEPLESLREVDQPMLDGLRAVGFRVDTAPFSPYQLQSHIHIDIGCTALLASGTIRLLTDCEPERFESRSLVFTSGTSLEADLVVFATGYETMDETCRRIFGSEVAGRAGPAWSPDGNPVGVCARSGHPRFWYSGGNILLARAYAVRLSQLIALSLSSFRPEEYERSPNNVPTFASRGTVPPWLAPLNYPAAPTSVSSASSIDYMPRVIVPRPRTPGVVPPLAVSPRARRRPHIVQSPVFSQPVPPSAILIPPPTVSSATRPGPVYPSASPAVRLPAAPCVIQEGIMGPPLRAISPSVIQVPVAEQRPVPQIVMPQYPRVSEAAPAEPELPSPIVGGGSQYFTPTESMDSPQ